MVPTGELGGAIAVTLVTVNIIRLFSVPGESPGGQSFLPPLIWRKRRPALSNPLYMDNPVSGRTGGSKNLKEDGGNCEQSFSTTVAAGGQPVWNLERRRI